MVSKASVGTVPATDVAAEPPPGASEATKHLCASQSTSCRAEKSFKKSPRSALTSGERSTAAGPDPPAGTYLSRERHFDGHGDHFGQQAAVEGHHGGSRVVVGKHQRHLHGHRAGAVNQPARPRGPRSQPRHSGAGGHRGNLHFSKRRARLLARVRTRATEGRLEPAQTPWSRRCFCGGRGLRLPCSSHSPRLSRGFRERPGAFAAADGHPRDSALVPGQHSPLWAFIFLPVT